MSKTKPFPAGNAAVGDPVYYFPTGKAPVQYGTVLEVGLTNEHGYNLNIRFTVTGGVEIIGAPSKDFSLHVDLARWWTGAPGSLYPLRLVEWINSDVAYNYKSGQREVWTPKPRLHLVPVRLGGNLEEARFEVLCLRCTSTLSVQIETTEFAALVAEKGGDADRFRLYEQKPWTADCAFNIVCNCDPDAQDLPTYLDDIDRYY